MKGILSHEQHAGHEMPETVGGQESHIGHEAHADHTGHEQMFRQRFWVSLVLIHPGIAFQPIPSRAGWVSPSPHSMRVSGLFRSLR